MTVYAIYGKRTGKTEEGIPMFDKQFRALTYDGIRVSRLEQAGTYATKEDAQAVLDKPKTKALAEEGLCEYQIRTIK